MVDKITFKNYKIFKEKQSLELKPITVIFGKNNSGKSSIAKLPTLLEGALNSNGSEILNFENEGVVLGADLRDLVYGKANRAMEFELTSGTDNLSFGIVISNDNNRQIALIDSWRFNKELDLQYSYRDKTYTDKLSNVDFVCEFSGLELERYSAAGESAFSRIDIDKVNLKTDFIGPIRTQPLRDYRLLPGSDTRKSGVFGENMYYYLIEDALTTEKKLISKVADWYKINFEGWEVRINQDKVPIFQIEIHRDELKQNILDTGIGMSQVLPVVTRAMMPCEEETLIIIEEPETHLHPAAHGNLASLFVDSLEQGNKRYLIETHSLNFVLRLRRLVAEKRLPKEKLLLYYVDFSEENNSSTLEKIEVDDLGRVDKWPDGIFNETLDETIAIRTAQIDHS